MPGESGAWLEQLSERVFFISELDTMTVRLRNAPYPSPLPSISFVPRYQVKKKNASFWGGLTRAQRSGRKRDRNAWWVPRLIETPWDLGPAWDMGPERACLRVIEMSKTSVEGFSKRLQKKNGNLGSLRVPKLQTLCPYGAQLFLKSHLVFTKGPLRLSHVKGKHTEGTRPRRFTSVDGRIKFFGPVLFQMLRFRGPQKRGLRREAADFETLSPPDAVVSSGTNYSSNAEKMASLLGM